MLPYLIIYSPKDIASFTRKRGSEIKLGQSVQTITNFPEDLQNSSAKYVLLGLPEDIGVRANYGRGGTQTAWKPALENILNIQSNEFLKGEELLVLGHVDFDDVMKKADALNQKTRDDIEYLRKLVEFVDARVCEVM
jgi:formiminoglutamase